MDIRATAGDIARSRVDTIVLGITAGSRHLDAAGKTVDAAMEGALSRLIAAGEIRGKKGELATIHTLGKIPAKRIVIVGLGASRDLSIDVIRSATGDALRALRGSGARRIATTILAEGAGKIDAPHAAQALVEGAILGLYQFNKHRKPADHANGVRELVIVDRSRAKLARVRAAIDVGRIIAESACLARDMTNEPANHMTPTHMAGVAEGVGKQCGLEVSVVDREGMERLGMGALLAVARGSAEPPMFVIMRYLGDPENPHRTLGLIGKGVTFDAGGISLKPAAGMSDMKTDMAGGACVIAAMRAIGLLKPRINVTGLVPATENLPSSTALKPGDVVTAMGGKTIEVENTDAEGRLILADALTYARQQSLSPLVDIATLTGAMKTTFGQTCTGVFTNHQPTLNGFLKSASAAGEKVWQMPMFEEYRDLIKSDIADIKNSGGRLAGSMAAAWFLAEFVGNTPWVHLDIAGTVRSELTRGHVVKGATGVMVRTLVQFALDSAQPGQPAAPAPT